MNDDSSSGVPAGWYPDPLGLSSLRWWSGREWTQHTNDPREPLSAQGSAPAATRRERRERDEQATSRLGERRSTERTLLQLEAPSSHDLKPGIPEPAPFGGFTDAVGGDSSTGFASEPPQDRRPHPEPHQQRPQQRQERRRADTGQPQQPGLAPRANHNGAVWMIALTPLFQLVFSLMILSALGGPDSAEIMSTAMTVLWIAPYPVTIGLAALDRTTLRKTGRQHTAHWLWALLSPPVYLIARARASARESRGGLGPVLVWFVVSPLLLASVIAVPALLIATMPVSFSAEVEQSVMADAALLGASLDVVCPPSPPTVVGQQFTCTATKDSGDSYQVDVSLQRLSGWIDWRVDDWGIYTTG